MEITICIITRNRPDELQECLASIADSSLVPAEIVVSDDSTNNATKMLVALQFPHVKFVEGPRRGLGPNRNSAIAAASSEWVLFLDDDARLGRDFLSILHPIVSANNGKSIIFTGIERQVKGPIYPQDQDFLGFQTRPYGENQSLNTLVINATLFPTQLVKTLQFDPRLIYGYDEVDIAARARARGWQIMLCENAVNYHFPSPVNRDYYRPHTETARIYVTFKKYLGAQRKPLKATAFLLLSFLHSLAHHLKCRKDGGVAAAIKLHWNAWRLIYAWWREPKHNFNITQQASHLISHN